MQKYAKNGSQVNNNNAGAGLQAFKYAERERVAGNANFQTRTDAMNA